MSSYELTEWAAFAQYEAEQQAKQEAGARERPGRGR